MYVLPLLLSLFFLPTMSSASDHQIVMNSGLGQPDYEPLTTPQPTLADLLTIEPSASIFYSYARELELSSMLSDQNAKMSLFVPTNKAIMALSRKPSVLVGITSFVHKLMGLNADIKGRNQPTRLKSQRRNMIKRRRTMWNNGYLLIYFRSASSSLCTCTY